MAGVEVHPAPERLSDRKFWKGVWAGVMVGIAALDLWRNSKHDKSTLSDGIRALFKTHTRKGKWRFLIYWTAFCVWFVRHIIK